MTELVTIGEVMAAGHGDSWPGTLSTRRHFVRYLTIDEERAMMTFGKIGEYVSAEAFRPFRIKMASGQTFEIRHPEMILVGRTSVRVYTATGTEAAPTWHDVSLMLMETLEPISAPQTQAN